jgi:AraC-like DNA-binding protein
MAPRARHIDHRIRKALDIIRNSKTPDIKLDEVARKVGLSRSHFYKRFKECVGTSPLHVVDSARIGRAIRMLGETDEPIAALAERLGFSTQGHFTRFFVQHLFVPPTRYRAWLRAEPAVRLSLNEELAGQIREMRGRRLPGRCSHST